MSKRRITIIIGLIVIIIGLFFVLKPKPATDLSAGATTHTYTLVVKNKKLITGPANLQVNQGDHVSITITNDASEELHLHGYDKKLELTADQPATLTFVASDSGRFEYELEGSNTVLGELEVQPR